MLSLDEIAEPPDARTHGTSLEALQQADRIRSAVLALPDKYRDAVTLYYFHEQSVPTAAQSLGVPEGTLKIRLHRGRELLRKKFGRAQTPPSIKTSTKERQ